METVLLPMNKPFVLLADPIIHLTCLASSDELRDCKLERVM